MSREETDVKHRVRQEGGQARNARQSPARILLFDLDMEKVYHICLRETEVPQSFNSHNTLLEKEGAHISLKYRRGPLVDLRDTYLVFWYEEGKVYCSRVNTARHGLDWMFFDDGHEMVECRDWEEFREKMAQFREKGYIEN